MFQVFRWVFFPWIRSWCFTINLAHQSQNALCLFKVLGLNGSSISWQLPVGSMLSYWSQGDFERMQLFKHVAISTLAKKNKVSFLADQFWKMMTTKFFVCEGRAYHFHPHQHGVVVLRKGRQLKERQDQDHQDNQKRPGKKQQRAFNRSRNDNTQAQSFSAVFQIEKYLNCLTYLYGLSFNQQSMWWNVMLAAQGLFLHLFDDVNHLLIHQANFTTDQSHQELNLVDLNLKEIFTWCRHPRQKKVRLLTLSLLWIQIHQFI